MAHPRTPGVPPGAWERLSVRYDRQLWLERSALRAAIELAGPRPADRLLDLGSGTGALLRALAAHPGRPRFAVGVDSSPAMLARVPALPAGWIVMEGDALTLPFGEDEFAVAVAAYVLHVLPEAVLAQALAELARVLRPGGRLVTVTPVVPRRGLLRAVAVVGDALGRRAPARWGGLRTFDPARALQLAGFTLVRGRVLQRGYPSLCVLAHGPAPTPTSSIPRGAGDR